MKTARFLIKSFGQKPSLVILASVLLLTTVFLGVAPSQVNEADKEKIVRQVAQKWIQVGMEQHRRGMFKAAEQSFLRAKDYERYLTAAERKRLNELLGQTHEGAVERKRILAHIQAADGLIKQGEPAKAKTHLEKVKGSEFLTEEEHKLIVEGLKKLDEQLDEQQKEAAELYGRSVELYRAGELEKARGGFAQLVKSGLVTMPAGQTPEDYLLKIDSVLAERAEPLSLFSAGAERTGLSVTDDLFELRGEIVQEAERDEMAGLVGAGASEAAEPATDEGGYIEVINRKRNILRSHTKAIVNDAVDKAQDYLNRGDFEAAKEATEAAERTVTKNQLHLGDDIFVRYSTQLNELLQKIVAKQNESALQLQEQKRLEAVDAQRRYREQMEADRSKRIAELMDNAMAYQKQQRYEEALGQLQSLLAIDPLNDRALTLKQTLEDMLGFRRQLEIERESETERVKTLIETDKSLVPYGGDYPTYPKNWREIAETRVPDEAIGQNPADVATYKQLDEIVDLSQLTPEMPLSEAIEELKNSVDPPLKIFVNWRDLYDGADIDQTTPINMDPISAIPLGRGLDLLLEAVSGGFAELDYAVADGVITIATQESIPSELRTLVYDVTDLLGRPADFYAETGGDVSVGGEGEAGTEELGEEDEIDRDELLQMAMLRADNLVLLIEETVEPDSWYSAGGDGTITVHENKKLIIRQTPKVHNDIMSLMNEIRKSFGQQVAIEARFLLVGENFLEDIGLDVDFRYDTENPKEWGVLDFRQNSFNLAAPSNTGITGSLVSPIAGDFGVLSSMGIIGGYGNILTDLQVNFLVRATQAHRDSKALTAPKVTVLSGESATLQVLRFQRYPYEIELDIEDIGDQGDFRWNVEYEEGTIVSGSLLNITPTIMHDKKHVLLNIVSQLTEFLGFQRFDIELPILGAGVPTVGENIYTVELPETEISRVQTRVSVPDGGTLLLGGQKLTAETEVEAGVPVLSKIPILGRLFTNRSTVKDSKVLLILVKPTIILQEETEAKAIAAMEGAF
ncbi:MAG: hypothetical protein ACYSR5_01380 [Planctomycetota bacterium]